MTKQTQEGERQAAIRGAHARTHTDRHRHRQADADPAAPRGARAAPRVEAERGAPLLGLRRGAGSAGGPCPCPCSPGPDSLSPEPAAAPC